MKIRTMVMIALVASGITLGVRVSIADPKPATADTLRQLESDFMKAAAERGADGYMSYYAEDAVEVPNGADAIYGKTNIASTMSFLNDKNNQLVWTPVYADISASGDLGTPRAPTSSTPGTRTAKPRSNTANTPASGRNRKMEAGKWCWTWGTRARGSEELLTAQVADCAFSAGLVILATGTVFAFPRQI